MGRLAEIAGELSHARTIEMSTFDVDEAHILASGRMRDVRLFPGLSPIGRAIEAGTLHDLSIRVLVEIPQMIIEEVEVSIDTVPLDDCLTLRHSLDAIVGLAIMPGFSDNVKARAGRVAGCTHLVYLLCTMAPSILQGYWAIMDKRTARGGDVAPAERARSFTKYMKNSCRAWREDGAAYRELVAIAGKGEAHKG
jgi:hypothetical protein